MTTGFLRRPLELPLVADAAERVLLGAASRIRVGVLTVVTPDGRHALREPAPLLGRAVRLESRRPVRYVGQGVAKGAVDTKMMDILKVLGARDLHPAKKHLARVAACTDLATLNLWFDRSLTAATAAKVFAD